MLRKKFKNKIKKHISYLGANSDEIMNILADILLELFKDKARYNIEKDGITIMEIRRFGTFKMKQTRERLARNPRSGDMIVASGKKKIIFRASEMIQERINRDSYGDKKEAEEA